MEHWIRQHPVLFWGVLFPSYLVGLYLLVCLAISYLGGWHALSLRFRTDGIFGGQKWNYQSGHMRGFLNYGNCLTMGASTAGLYLRPHALLRFRHPALFIPWHEIRVKQERFFFRNMTTLYLSSEYSIALRISDRLAGKLAKAAGDRWPAEVPTAF